VSKRGETTVITGRSGVRVIERLREKGMTLVMVTHHRELARRLGDRVVELGSTNNAGPISMR
jgi:ABC-type polar amino acid transport system ATPase subunit